MPHDELQDPCPQPWFDGFLSGIRQQESLLALLLARVAPESAVVAAGTLGLLGHEALVNSDVALEANVAGISRIDMVVSHTQSQVQHSFEWKLLWERGFKECTNKIVKDRKKLGSLPHSAVIVFAYAVRKAPGCCHGRVTDVDLADTVARVIGILGQPFRSSDIRQIEAHAVTLQYQLLAWTSQPSPSQLPA